MKRKMNKSGAHALVAQLEKYDRETAKAIARAAWRSLSILERAALALNPAFWADRT